MATIQNALEISNYLPQTANHLPQVINADNGVLTRISNQAMPPIDVSSITLELTQVNTYFSQMEQAIEEVDAAQQRLNDRLSRGGTVVDGMMNKVKGLVANVLNFDNLKVVIGLSDEMATTQRHLDSMNAAYQKQAQDAGVVNTELTSTSALQKSIFDSAQRTFSSYQTTAAMVQQLGTAASDAFSSPAEIVAFTEQMNKNMAISGASPQAMSSVTQAMTSGSMDSAGLNQLVVEAPVVVDNIQKYLEDIMNIDASQMEQLASEGRITADVIKNAMFYAAQQTNDTFASLPKTWGNIWQNIKTGALQAFSPILLKINELANSEKIQQLVNGIVNALGVVAGWAMNVMNVFITIGNFIYDNWSMIGPVVLGLAGILLTLVTYLDLVKGVTTLVSVATWVWNAALAANPIVLIILALIALIAIFYLIIGAINHFAGTSISATGIVAGAFMLLGAAIYNKIAYIWNIIAALVEFFANVWTNPMYSVKRLFYNLAINVLDQLIAMTKGWDGFATNFVNAIIKAVNIAITTWNKFVNLLPDKVTTTLGLDTGELLKGKESITSDIVNARDLLVKEIENPPGDYWEAPKMETKILHDSYKKGENWGSNYFKKKQEEPSEKLPSYGPVDQFSNLGDQMKKGNDFTKQVADNTGTMANGVTLMNDELKYMRDLAEREAINRYTTAEIIVDARSENHINSELDIDGVIDRFGQKVEEVAVGLAESGGVSLV